MHHLAKGVPRRALTRTLAALTLASAVGIALPAAPAAAAAPPLPSDVTAFSQPLIDPSGLFIINRGLDNSILLSRGTPSTNSYSDFFSIGGQITGDPTAAIAPEGVQVFARAGNQAVTNLVVSFAFPTGFQPIPGLAISSEIAAVRIPPQGSLPPMIRIFARGQEDGAVYTNLLIQGAPQGWVSLGGFITSEISAAIIGPLGFPPNIRLAVRGGDNRLYTMVLNNANGVVSDWAPVGDLIVGSNPSLSGQNLLTDFRGNEVFVVDAFSRAAFTWNFDSPGWVNLGGRVVGDIAVSIPIDNGLHLHVRGTTNNAYLNRRPPGSTRFGGYINLGGVLTGNISASGGGAINRRTVVDQFVTRTRENGISSRIMLNLVGGFTSFFNINGPPQG